VDKDDVERFLSHVHLRSGRVAIVEPTRSERWMPHEDR